MSFISDLITNITSFRTKVGEKLNKLWLDIGDKTNLTTTNKTNLVEAVNEVNSKSLVYEYTTPTPGPSITNKVPLKNIYGEDLTAVNDSFLYDVSLNVKETGTVTGARYVVRHNGTSWEVNAIGSFPAISNNPSMIIVNGIPCLSTEHSNNYHLNVNVRAYKVFNSNLNWIKLLGLGFDAVQDKPTTLVGYGITDGVNVSQVYTKSQALALFVGKNGVETIADTKTFTHSPIVPNATLNSHAVNLGQLQTYVTGLGYTTMSAVQAWVNSQSFAKTSQIPTVGNGSVALQGTGSLQGTVTFSMNQSNNIVGSFDLTAAEKTRIQQGVDAYNVTSTQQGFQVIDNATSGMLIDVGMNKKTLVKISDSVADFQLDKGNYTGQEICFSTVYILGGTKYNVNGSVDTTMNTMDFESNTVWWYDGITQKWYLASF